MTDLVKYAVVVVVLFFGARYLMGDAARRATARAAEDHAEQADSILDAAEELVTEATTARLAAEEDTVRLSGLLETLRASEEQIRRDADLEIARLEDQLEALAAARTESASGFRKSLPEELRDPFDEHEAIHAAELAAANETIRQRERTIRSADAFRAQMDNTIVGLRSLLVEVSAERDEERVAKLKAIKARDAWHVASDRYKAVLDMGLLSRLVKDVETTLVAIGIGYAGAKFLGG